MGMEKVVQNETEESSLDSQQHEVPDRRCDE